MKKEYIAPDSHVIMINETAPLLGSDEIRITDAGFEVGFGEDNVDEGN